MKSQQAKRIRAMRERMEKVVGGRVSKASDLVQAIDKQRSSLVSEMHEFQQQLQTPEASSEQLMVAASTLKKARSRVLELSAKRDEAVESLLELESELHDARRATEMADRLCEKLRASDNARRDKLERELSDDTGSRIATLRKQSHEETK